MTKYNKTLKKLGNVAIAFSVNLKANSYNYAQILNRLSEIRSDYKNFSQYLNGLPKYIETMYHIRHAVRKQMKSEGFEIDPTKIYDANKYADFVSEFNKRVATSSTQKFNESQISTIGVLYNSLGFNDINLYDSGVKRVADVLIERLKDDIKTSITDLDERIKETKKAKRYVDDLSKSNFDIGALGKFHEYLEESSRSKNTKQLAAGFEALPKFTLLCNAFSDPARLGSTIGFDLNDQSLVEVINAKTDELNRIRIDFKNSSDAVYRKLSNDLHVPKNFRTQALITDVQTRVPSANGLTCIDFKDSEEFKEALANSEKIDKAEVEILDQGLGDLLVEMKSLIEEKEAVIKEKEDLLKDTNKSIKEKEAVIEERKSLIEDNLSILSHKRCYPLYQLFKSNLFKSNGFLSRDAEVVNYTINADVDTSYAKNSLLDILVKSQNEAEKPEEVTVTPSTELINTKVCSMDAGTTRT